MRKNFFVLFIFTIYPAISLTQTIGLLRSTISTESYLDISGFMLGQQHGNYHYRSRHHLSISSKSNGSAFTTFTPNIQYINPSVEIEEENIIYANEWQLTSEIQECNDAFLENNITDKDIVGLACYKIVYGKATAPVHD